METSGQISRVLKHCGHTFLGEVETVRELRWQPQELSRVVRRGQGPRAWRRVGAIEERCEFLEPVSGGQEGTGEGKEGYCPSSFASRRGWAPRMNRSKMERREVGLSFAQKQETRS